MRSMTGLIISIGRIGDQVAKKKKEPVRVKACMATIPELSIIRHVEKSSFRVIRYRLGRVEYTDSI